MHGTPGSLSKFVKIRVTRILGMRILFRRTCVCVCGTEEEKGVAKDEANWGLKKRRKKRSCYLFSHGGGFAHEEGRGGIEYEKTGALFAYQTLHGRKIQILGHFGGRNKCCFPTKIRFFSRWGFRAGYTINIHAFFAR